MPSFYKTRSLNHIVLFPNIVETWFTLEILLRLSLTYLSFMLKNGWISLKVGFPLDFPK